MTLWYTSDLGGTWHIYVAHWSGNAFASPMLLPVAGPTGEMDPAVSHDGTRLYFASVRDGGMGALDIYVATIPDGGSQFSVVTPVPAINSADDDADPVITSTDGNILFSSTRAGGVGSSDIWNFNLVSMTATNFAIVNSPEFDGNPSITDDRNQVFFESRRGGADSDLWVLTRSADGGFTDPPVPVAELQTLDDEASPGISGDGQRLVFSSTRPGGQGSNDLWMTQRLCR